MAGNVLTGLIHRDRHTSVQAAMCWAGMASFFAFITVHHAVFTSFGLGFWPKLLFIAVWGSGWYGAYRCAPAWSSRWGVARTCAWIATLGLAAAAVTAVLAASGVHALWMVMVPMPVAAGCGFLFYSGALVDADWRAPRRPWPVLLIGLTVPAVGMLLLDWLFGDELKGLAAMQLISAVVLVILVRSSAPRS